MKGSRLACNWGLMSGGELRLMAAWQTHVEAEEGEDGRQVDGAAQGRDDAAEQVQVRVRDAGQRADQLRGRAGEPGQHQPHDDGCVVQAPAQADTMHQHASSGRIASIGAVDIHLPYDEERDTRSEYWHKPGGMAPRVLSLNQQILQALQCRRAYDKNESGRARSLLKLTGQRREHTTTSAHCESSACRTAVSCKRIHANIGHAIEKPECL